MQSAAKPSVALEEIELDIWNWIREFVAAKNAFYDGRFAPCPYALGAVRANSVDVIAWSAGSFTGLIRRSAEQMRTLPQLTTRVMAFPPRVQRAWRLSQFVDALNGELIPDDIFLNTGTAKTTISRYPGSNGDAYFIVIANRLDAVLAGAEALKRTSFYDNWPARQVDIVVHRRERLYRRYGAPRKRRESQEQ